MLVAFALGIPTSVVTGTAWLRSDLKDMVASLEVVKQIVFLLSLCFFGSPSSLQFWFKLNIGFHVHLYIWCHKLFVRSSFCGGYGGV